MSRETDIAWASGLFEGEGCITAGGDTGKSKTPTLQLDITDEDVIRRFAAVFGGNVTGPYNRGSNKPIYSWRLYGVKFVQETLKLMEPYLGERRKARAAEMIAEYYEAPVYRRRGRGERAAGVPPPRLETSKYARYRARKEGFDVPKQKPGPKPGSKEQARSC